MQQTGQNARYLPGVELPAALQFSSQALPDLFSQPPESIPDLIVLATPMKALRAQLQAVVSSPCRHVPVAWLCKGFESQTGLLGHEVLAQVDAGAAHGAVDGVAPGMVAGVLSGPSFAQEVAARCPTALVAASPHARVREQLVAAFHNPSLRIYANDDMAGVEVGGAVKNVLAIATGLCDGLQLGLNARAALITRGLAEMTRLGLALGGRAETFMGLSGLGDLVLTATGDLSRNRRVGQALAAGQTLQQAVDSLGHVAEGVYSARTVWARAQQLGIDMPITHCVVRLLDGACTPAQAVAALMGRDPTSE